MAKAKSEVRGERDEEVYTTATHLLEGGRWLKPEDKDAALVALTQLRQKAGMAVKENAEVGSEKLWEIIGQVPMSWDALKHQLARSDAPHSRTWQGAIALASRLLKQPEEEITQGTPPSGRSANGGQAQPQGYLLVSYPTRIADHRAVILGQLPDAGLRAALFVKPVDGKPYWYPQCGMKTKHNPLQVGTAFACFCYFGNPDWEEPNEAPAQTYAVRVYAVGAEWPHGTNRLKENELDAKLGALGNQGFVEVKVERSSPVQSVTISGLRDTQKLSFESVRRARCAAPIEIAWTGQQDAHVEIRKGRGDTHVWNDLVKTPLVLTGPGAVETRGRRVALQGSGLYRVRLYPLRWSFVDPPYEFWLDLALPHTTRARGPATRASHHHGPRSTLGRSRHGSPGA